MKNFKNESVYFIAEAGVNHNGSLKKALSLIDIASRAGADAVKFQTFNPQKLLLKNAEKPQYQKKNVPKISQYQMLEKLQLSFSDQQKLFSYAKKKKIDFLSTPYDEESAVFLEKLGVKAFKLSSIEVINHPFLDFVSRRGKPAILSLGLANEEEIRQAVNIFKKNRALEKLILLHCHSDYPTKPANANLLKIKTLQKKFPQNLIGYSDHTQGELACLLAVGMGAKIIEKHFTCNKNAAGPDHNCSSSPKELESLIKNLRTAEQLLGNKELKRTKDEEKNLVMRKSLVSVLDIPKNSKVKLLMMAAKRPGNGLWPTYDNINYILTKKTKIAIAKDTVLKMEMFK